MKLKNIKLFSHPPTKRTVAGIVCIALALVLCLAVAPAVTARAAKTSSVYVYTSAVESGTVLTADMIEKREIPASLVPKDAVTDPASVLGLVHLVPRNAGDVLLSTSLGAPAEAAPQDYLSDAGKGRYAVSLPLSGLSAGLCGKLCPCDTVSVHFLTRDGVISYPSLSEVTVVSLSSSDASPAGSGKVPAAVTVLATKAQLKDILEGLSYGTCHLALVRREGGSDA